MHHGCQSGQMMMACFLHISCMKTEACHCICTTIPVHAHLSKNFSEYADGCIPTTTDISVFCGQPCGTCVRPNIAECVGPNNKAE